ncbi:thiamine-phosphate synthase family protein [Desulfurococcus amylolyticus]|uniref:thiamine-phosphate synthase family protein n=1 Tax=Desulfurococcus amylolyticus TaxID=94694 RepID=UPI0005B23139|nr:thiamine-phosphate synthase family protein [Desulfurococcus amylolyticus]
MIIHEIICGKILVSLRGLLAHKLSDQGLSQHKISRLLNVSQPMINKLLKRPVEEYLGELEKLGIERGIVEYYVEILCSIAFAQSLEKFVFTSYQVVNTLALKALCSQQDFSNICQGGVFVDPDIEYYKTVLSRLLSIKGLHKLIPEVGSNLVYTPKAPSSIMDVIGLTGRIVKTLSGVTATGEPMYGGSQHLSRILLLVMLHNPVKKYGFNTRYEEAYLSSFNRLGLRTVITGPHENQEEFWRRIGEVSRLKPDIIVDLGGRGLEPVVYVFTSSYEELERILVNLVEACP